MTYLAKYEKLVELKEEAYDAQGIVNAFYDGQDEDYDFTQEEAEAEAEKAGNVFEAYCKELNIDEDTAEVLTYIAEDRVKAQYLEEADTNRARGVLHLQLG